MSHQKSKAVIEFKQKRTSLTMTAVCGREFILVESLQRWLCKPPEDGLGDTNVARLLYEMYPKGMTMSAEALNKHSRIVFCILLDLDAGALIYNCVRHEWAETGLPKPLDSLKVHFRKIVKLEADADRLARNFYHIQYAYCPVRLELDGFKDLDEDRVLPFCQKSLISDKGGTATLWQVAVPQEFIGRKLQERLEKGSWYDNAPADKFGMRYAFALKTFNDGHKEAYDNETTAFCYLREHNGMARSLFEYSHVSPRTPPQPPSRQSSGFSSASDSKTYNIILEYALHDLEDYFNQVEPPNITEELEGLYTSVFKIAPAVAGLHILKNKVDGFNRVYYGVHADIKPDNILNIGGEFKLSDPGFAQFVPKANGQPRLRYTGGTRTYAGPESAMASESGLVPQRIDLWSLGCVFSELATYIVLGKEGLNQYTYLRLSAVAQAGTQSTGDFFHDGNRVLAVVTQWHTHLRMVTRRNDSMTAALLDVVDRDLLVSKPELRIAADDLCAKLDAIINKRPPTTDIIYGPTDLVKQGLAEYYKLHATKQKEDAALLSPTRSKVIHMSFRKARSHKRERPRLPIEMTTHRSALKPPQSLLNPPIFAATYTAAPEGEAEIDFDYAPLASSDESPQTTSTFSTPYSPEFPEPTSQTSIFHHGHQRRTTLQSIAETVPIGHGVHPNVTPPRIEIPAQARPTQNVFQAARSIRLGRKSFFSPASFKKDPDDVVKTHCQGRDIIFIVDNARSMDQYWAELEVLLGVLVTRAGDMDDDGVDMLFTTGKDIVKGKKDQSPFLKAINKADNMPSDIKTTNMAQCLGNVFLDASKKLGKTKTKKSGLFKGLTLIILTDGIWEGTTDNVAVRDKIIKFVKEIAEQMKHVERPFSIQFIQFGADFQATAYLDYLDDQMEKHGIPDVIDVEPSNGSIYKMLLGSFVRKFDEGQTVGSPPRSMSQSDPFYAVTEGPLNRPDEHRPGSLEEQSPRQYQAQYPPSSLPDPGTPTRQLSQSTSRRLPPRLSLQPR